MPFPSRSFVLFPLFRPVASGSHRVLRPCVVAFFCVVLGVASGGSAFARPAQALWVDRAQTATEKDAMLPTNRDEARRAAFGEAVFDEAKDMLRDALSEERGVFLRAFLAPKASRFIVSYTEQGVENLGDGTMRLLVDAQVNRAALRTELRKLGFFGETATVAYNPQYGSVQPGTWELLGRLHVLYGLSPSSDAPLTLRLSQEGKIWTVSLQDGTASLPSGMTPLFARSESLETAWYDVWGAYFDSRAAKMVQAGGAMLQVDGWYTPDGVEAFDTMLQGWTDLLDEVALEQVVFAPTSVSGQWRVTVLDVEALRARLAEYVGQRGLVVQLEQLAQ